MVTVAEAASVRIRLKVELNVAGRKPAKGAPNPNPNRPLEASERRLAAHIKHQHGAGCTSQGSWLELGWLGSGLGLGLYTYGS